MFMISLAAGSFGQTSTWSVFGSDVGMALLVKGPEPVSEITAALLDKVILLDLGLELLLLPIELVGKLLNLVDRDVPFILHVLSAMFGKGDLILKHFVLLSQEGEALLGVVGLVLLVYDAFQQLILALLCQLLLS